jgi:hypothetical protein
VEAVDAVVEEEKEVVISASSSDDPSKGLPPPRRRLGFISGIHRLPLPNLETTWPSLLSHHLSRMVAREAPLRSREISLIPPKNILRNEGKKGCGGGTGEGGRRLHTIRYGGLSALIVSSEASEPK